MKCMGSLHIINLTSIGETELYTAISDFVGAALPAGDRTQEGYTVDFKEEWSDKSLRVIAAFANTFGGVIVIGVSEATGRADEIVGVLSKNEFTTKIASSIASNISPVPDFDIAECGLPNEQGKRLAVIRVRSNGRIHFLLKGDRPIYVRNADQAIPALAAETRALIARERALSEPTVDPQNPFPFLPPDFKITRAREAGTVEEKRRNRVDSQTWMRVLVRPVGMTAIPLDYLYEDQFRNLVADQFPKYQETVKNDMAAEEDWRSRNAYLYKVYRPDMDLEAKWTITSSGIVGFACSIAIELARRSWSLPDVAANIATTVGLANDVLTAQGYYGEVDVLVEVEPGGGVILTEGSGFASLLRKDYYPIPWPIVIPQFSAKPIHLKGVASERLDFNQRFGDLKPSLARMLNQVLRDLGLAVDLMSLKQAL